MELGIETVYISPHYLSPMEDGGYDITNFTQVNPILGTMEDFKELIDETKARGLKLIVDIIINHSSDKHPWFIKSVNREDPYTDFYVWRDPKSYDYNGKPIPPNNWVSIFKGSAWQWNEQRKQFYLHQFTLHQPDFNLRNNLLKTEIKKIFKFWLDKGVAGFRIDATKYLIEDAEFRDDPVKPGVIVPYTYQDVTHLYTADLWETYVFLHEIRLFCDRVTKKFTDYERILLPEAYGGGKMLYQYYGSKDYKIAHFPLNFAFVLIVEYKNASFYHNLINNYLSPIPEGGIPSWNSENHDKFRKAMVYNPEYEYIFTTMVMLLPGVAYTYYGQEIGMIGARIRDDQKRDSNPDDFTKTTRDSCRLPMQWDDSFNAGFSTNPKTHLPVSSEYWKINVKKQKADKNSHYYIFKRMLDLRKTDVFKYGDFKSYVVSTWVFAFTRTLKGQGTFLVVLNLGSETEMVNLSSVIHKLPETMNVELSSPNSGYSVGDEIATSATIPNTFILRPFGAVVLSSKMPGS
ncbi:maltase 2-like isoform X2 [Planococcus citri]